MLNNLQIKDFKCLDNEEFDLKNLTIITGTNSSGKSSVLQSILLFSHYVGKRPFLSEQFRTFSEIRNRFANAKELSISADDIKLYLNSDNQPCYDSKRDDITFEKDIYLISENRTGPEEIAKYSTESDIGMNGEYIFGYYEQNKAVPIEKDLLVDEISTLQHNVDYWLTRILDARTELNTEKATADNVKVSYSFEGLDKVSPFHLGAGVSYLVKILIVCLYAKKGNTILIENPEIHLHPKAQSKLGEFFAFAASRGIQLILETHCEHIINRIRYEVYNNNISSDDTAIYYKESVRKPFQRIFISDSGKYENEDNKKIQFPSGFFDSTLSELLEIG